MLTRLTGTTIERARGIDCAASAWEWISVASQYVTRIDEIQTARLRSRARERLRTSDP